jgi:hypothetical protein
MGPRIKTHALSLSTGRQSADATRVSHPSLKKLNSGLPRHHAGGGAVGLAMNLLGG